MIELIKNILRSVWNFIKKIFSKIINFCKNIVGWFKQPERLKKLLEDRNRMAISIKERLENGNYNVVNCIFDKEKEELVDYEEDAVVIEGEELDSETKEYFGDNDMLVIKI